jgi:site-specific DNA-methyltransferase (adenine-specific)
MNGNDTALFSKASDEWETPQWLFDLLDREFHFDYDLACTKKNCKCQCGIFVPEQDALIFPWKWLGSRDIIGFLNPPYSKIGQFMEKAYEESQKGATIVCLIPARTDTKYWHDYVMKAQEIRFIKGRLKFGDSKNSAPFPSVIVIFDKNATGYVGGYPRIGKTIAAAAGEQTGNREE